MMRKSLIRVLIVLILISLCGCALKQLPLPQVTTGIRGELGIDENINEETIDNFLNRKDCVYRDMRMLKDEANFEAIGGDSNLSGYIKGFEVVPYPYLCDSIDLPQEVGEPYIGETLFSLIDGEYLANYAESIEILEEIFPQDKNIILMCGGGGYAGMAKNLLVNLGWDENKIYNAGGYWYYKGKNNIDLSYEENSETKYNFDELIYHDIDFASLTKIREQDINRDKKHVKLSDKFIKLETIEDLNALENNNESFALFVYLDSCSSCVSFMPIVEEFIEGNDIKMYAIKLSDVYKTSNSVSDRLDYTPSVLIYVDGKVIAYLDPTSDYDEPYYKTVENLSLWFSNYIDIDIIKTDTVNNNGDCNEGCSILD